VRTLKLLLLAIILVVLVVVALANRELVTLNLLPAGMARVMQVSVQVPLFVVGLAGVIVGMLIGYIFEWLREHKHRRRAAQKAREAKQLNAEMDRLRKTTGKHDDDVLTLLGKS
jgi:uncharacterized integral membrane protein